jgi:hypothetical protein
MDIQEQLNQALKEIDRLKKENIQLKKISIKQKVVIHLIVEHLI